MIDRLKLTPAARNQLSALKRKTGIEHNNALCRHALCLSLANPSLPPTERHSFAGGIEIDFRTFTGGHEGLYINLLATRLSVDGLSVSSETLREALALHVHRGLSYLASRREADLALELGRSLSIAWR
jgi:DNA sulfur modification protein DndE